eukprot:5393946-Pleurochrysis_carterae.AAC.1
MELLYACLRVIAHDILSAMEGQPEDFILKCFGEQFADAKKMGLKTPEGCKLKSHTHYMQNIVAKLALSDFS